MRPMNRFGVLLGMTIAFATPCFADQATSTAALPPAVKKRVEASIAKLRHPEERALAHEWSPAKQVAETLCSPFALKQWKKMDPTADRMVLGDDGEKSLELEEGGSITGHGQVRHKDGWTSFRFTCTVDARDGSVKSFQHTDEKG